MIPFGDGYREHRRAALERKAPAPPSAARLPCARDAHGAGRLEAPPKHADLARQARAGTPHPRRDDARSRLFGDRELLLAGLRLRARLARVPRGVLGARGDGELAGWQRKGHEQGGDGDHADAGDRLGPQESPMATLETIGCGGRGRGEQAWPQTDAAWR